MDFSAQFTQHWTPLSEEDENCSFQSVKFKKGDIFVPFHPINDSKTACTCTLMGLIIIIATTINFNDMYMYVHAREHNVFSNL